MVPILRADLYIQESFNRSNAVTQQRELMLKRKSYQASCNYQTAQESLENQVKHIRTKIWRVIDGGGLGFTAN